MPEYMNHPDAQVSAHDRAVAALISDSLEVEDEALCVAMDAWLFLEDLERLTDTRTAARLWFLFSQSGLRERFDGAGGAIAGPVRRDVGTC
ncbi:hypothetical protein [Aureimonas populi]|uniref:Uncharacterized protein n=1 Tax=Aureimonas populi TaxID=1701758 RepID=A0ABW5CKC2_9HYPH|nr:hypothetical protein [Aureimonas populi]